MWQIHSKNLPAAGFYPALEKELSSLIGGERNLIANLSNISSWLYHALPDLNWCGFYLWVEADQELVLGPFQGMPACLRIKSGRGVCGTAFAQARTIRVDDVNVFPGHIACDQASQSELVIPMKQEGKVLAVLDLDSPRLKRFTAQDEQELTRIMNHLSQKIF